MRENYRNVGIQFEMTYVHTKGILFGGIILCEIIFLSYFRRTHTNVLRSADFIPPKSCQREDEKRIGILKCQESWKFNRISSKNKVEDVSRE